MVPYDHKVQYYETDGMGIVHHSNYIRWFEEARVDLLEQLGFGYDRIEEAGYSGPVLEVSCSTKPCRNSAKPCESKHLSRSTTACA